MTTKYIQRGDVIDYVNGGTARTSGEAILIGVRLGVAVAAIAANATGAVMVQGVVSVAKATGAITQGAALYWSAANSNLTTTATGNALAGYAFKAAASGDPEVQVNLNA